MLNFELLQTPRWSDYELLDSGNGEKLERYGDYTFIRPETQALWRPALAASVWKEAHAAFAVSGDSGNWEIRKKIPEQWLMDYQGIKFWAQPTPFRHMGVFPEQACHWDWAKALLESRPQPSQVLNLFGYTGVFSLVAASAGAHVTHLDASKKSITWAKENQAAAGLSDKPIRWMLDDAQKFVEREARRGKRYDGFIIDPPKYGKGPKGEVWKIEDSLHSLFMACRGILSDEPLFLVTTIYANKLSSVTLAQILSETMTGYAGTLSCGEMLIEESSAQRQISASMFARWSK